ELPETACPGDSARQYSAIPFSDPVHRLNHLREAVLPVTHADTLPIFTPTFIRRREELTIRFGSNPDPAAAGSLAGYDSTGCFIRFSWVYRGSCLDYELHAARSLSVVKHRRIH